MARVGAQDKHAFGLGKRSWLRTCVGRLASSSSRYESRKAESRAYNLRETAYAESLER
jgi:hypothetical protein